MTLTTVVLLVLLLFLVQVFLQETSRYRFNLRETLGSRDTRPSDPVIAARLSRAKNNMLEALPLFLGLAMLSLVKGANTWAPATGATVFLIARTFYVPIYAAGIPVLRLVVWLVGVGGLVMMALPLL